MKHLKIFEEYSNILNKDLYHISGKAFSVFSKKYLLKGSGVNEQGSGIYFSESIEYITKYYKGKTNFLYTINFKYEPTFIDFDNIVNDDIYDKLSKLNNNMVDVISAPYNRNITGEALLYALKQHIPNIEELYPSCGIHGLTYVSDNVRNYCIFDTNIIKIKKIEDI